MEGLLFLAHELFPIVALANKGVVLRLVLGVAVLYLRENLGVALFEDLHVADQVLLVIFQFLLNLLLHFFGLLSFFLLEPTALNGSFKFLLDKKSLVESLKLILTRLDVTQ